MKMNKKGVGWEGYLIGLIIMVAVVIISIIGIAHWFPNLFAFFRKGYEDLPASDKSKIDANFNQFIENIKACAEIDDGECLCPGLPNFPLTFRPECKLEIEQKDSSVTISLLFNTKSALSANIEQVKISAVSFYKKWSESPYFKQLGEKKTIDFKLLKIIELKKVKREWIEEEMRYREFIEEEKWVPFFQPKSRYTANKMPILSEQFYKLNGSNLSFLVLPGVGFITKTAEEITKQSEEREKLPICMPKRLDAIKEFDKIVNALKKREERELTIELPQNYRMWIFGKGNIVLQYKKEEKGELVQKYGETILEKSVHEVFTFDIKCKESTEDVFLLDGDKIRIKKTAKAACIEKV